MPGAKVQDCVARQAELDRQEANAKARYRELLGELGVEGAAFQESSYLLSSSKSPF